MVSIGIDLGSTTSGIAVIRDKQCVKIPLMDGDFLMPSVLYFDPQGSVVLGSEAVDHIICDPESTVYDTKVILGRKSSDSIVQQFALTATFNVVLDQDRPKIRIIQNGRSQDITPEQIAHIILQTLTAYATEYLKEPVYNVVVTVPASFDESQRTATIEACRLAQLPNCELLNEPSAAIFGYHSEVKFQNGCKLLVFDLGGGTFDLAILKYEDSIFSVIRTLGDTTLGGRDFDHCLVRHCIQWFRNHCTNANGRDFQLHVLRRACENAKKRLSSMDSTRIVVKKFWNTTDLDVDVSRDQFEAMIEPLCARIQFLVLKILRDARMSSNEIDRVFPIGGSVRVPKVRRMLKMLFSETQICENLNPETAVLTGAAHYADCLKNSVQPKIKDVISQGLGISTSTGEMVFLVPPNTPIPVTVTQYVHPNVRNAEYVIIELYEGRSLIAKENRLMRQFQMPISRGSRKLPLITVELRVDSQGFVDVIATETGTGRTMSETGIRYTK